MKIQELAERTGLSEYTLRYYEKIGLIKPVSKDASGHRNYSEEDSKWIEFIKRLKNTGMPLKQITKFLRLLEQGDATILERYEILLSHTTSLEEKINNLVAYKQELEEKIRIYAKIVKKS